MKMKGTLSALHLLRYQHTSSEIQSTTFGPLRFYQVHPLLFPNRSNGVLLVHPWTPIAVGGSRIRPIPGIKTPFHPTHQNASTWSGAVGWIHLDRTMGVLEEATVQLMGVKRGDRVLARPFLDVCRGVLPILEQLGTGMALVRKDISGNIERLEVRVAEKPAAYEDLLDVVRDEIQRGVQENNSGCTKGLLWLCRAMRFMVGFMRRLVEDPNVTMYDAISSSYQEVLAPYHSWITGSVFSLALKVVPNKDTFFAKLGSGAQTETMVHDYCNRLSPLLQHVMDFMEEQGVNFPDKV